MYSRTSNCIIRLTVIASISIGACDGLESDFDTSAYPGIEISVKSQAGDYACDQIIAVVFEDNFRDASIANGLNELGQITSLGGAYERPGTYSLIITSDAFETYTRFPDSDEGWSVSC